jgi:ADP-ribose pyrophosphatase
VTGDDQRVDGHDRDGDGIDAGDDGTDNGIDGTDNGIDGTDNGIDGTDNGIDGIDGTDNGIDGIDGTDNGIDGIDGIDAGDDADPLAWETKRREVTYECPGFEIVREDVELPDGTTADFDYLVDDPAVVLLAFTPDGDVVLVEEWRQAVGRVNRALPAGGVEAADPDFAAAARRELAEETGYEAASVEKVGEFEPANGISNAVHHYYVARGCEPTAEQDLDFNESIRVTTRSYDDLLAAVRDGEIRDGRTALGVLQYELQ